MGGNSSFMLELIKTARNITKSHESLLRVAENLGKAIARLLLIAR